MSVMSSNLLSVFKNCVQYWIFKCVLSAPAAALQLHQEQPGKGSCPLRLHHLLLRCLCKRINFILVSNSITRSIFLHTRGCSFSTCQRCCCTRAHSLSFLFRHFQLLAAFRFLCLQVGYAAFRLKHWCVIAVSRLPTAALPLVTLFKTPTCSDPRFCTPLQVTTLVTSVFLVVKVIESNVSTHPSTPTPLTPQCTSVF